MRLLLPNFNKSSKGFTLIELLVVVSVMAILSGAVITVINVPRMQMKARDSQRVADAKRIQTAIELYYADNRTYPTAANFTRPSSVSAISTYMNGDVPDDPKFTSTSYNCTTTGHNYLYRANAAGRYVVIAHMEINDSSRDGNCSSITNCSTLGCNCSGVCYAVQNPF